MSPPEMWQPVGIWTGKRSVHTGSRARRNCITFFPTLQTGICRNRDFLDSTLDSCEKYFAPSKGPALRESLSEILGQRAAGDCAPRIALPLLPCYLLEESEYVIEGGQEQVPGSHSSLSLIPALESPRGRAASYCLHRSLVEQPSFVSGPLPSLYTFN